MPELPDITVYIEALESRILDHTLEHAHINSSFLVRTAAPPISSIEGRRIVELRRLGKRICFGVEGDLWIVLHLMIAGRLHWKQQAVSLARDKKYPLRVAKNNLAVFHFDNGQLSLTEAGTQRRASLHLVHGEEALRALDPGGVELFACQKPASRGGQTKAGLGRFSELSTFRQILQSENHTLKRALTDPRLFSGIGNAYSDEILWQAQLSPVKLTQRMTEEEVDRLYHATREALVEWIERLRNVTGAGFPEKVTAFRKDMAVHGRYREACRRCGAKVQRIRYATNETNYCPKCQTGGKLLADRALSRVMREDWPKTAEELG